MGEVATPLTLLVRKNNKIRVYLNESPHAHTTSFVSCIATGLFSEEGLPEVLPTAEEFDSYDFYLGETKVVFKKPPPPKWVTVRHINGRPKPAKYEEVLTENNKTKIKKKVRRSTKTSQNENNRRNTRKSTLK